MDNPGFERNFPGTDNQGNRTYGAVDEMEDSRDADGNNRGRSRHRNSRGNEYNPNVNKNGRNTKRGSTEDNRLGGGNQTGVGVGIDIELSSENPKNISKMNQSLTDNNGSNEKVNSKGDHQQEDSHEDDPNLGEPNIFGRVVMAVRSGIGNVISSHKKKSNIFFIVMAALLYNSYLIAAIHFSVTYEDEIPWCDGVGILIVITALVYWSFFYYFVIKRYMGKTIKETIFRPLKTIFGPIVGRPYFSYGMGFLVFAAFIVYIVIDAKDQPKRLISAAGIFVVLILGLLVSKHPGRVKWSMVMWGLGLQFVFGLIILKWDGGREAFNCLSSKVKIFLDYTDAGSGFVYGYLATGVNQTIVDGEPPLLLGSVFVFKSLSVIFFFSFFISLLYHYGAMMWIVAKLGWFLQITIGSTAAESMNASANIFVGQTEAPILIKPFLDDMTKSELHAVMTGGFATIAGSVMGAYISFGIEPSYLLSASIMAAPAALAMSKLVYPETKISKTTAAQMKSISLKTEGNALDAAAQGATQGVMLIGNIVASLIAFMAFVAFLNAMLSWFGALVGWDELSFEYLLGKIFIPVAYILGVDSEETEEVALLLGLKTIVNEFVAYQRLVSPSMAHLSCRSRAIATYALCSFANLSSIGIQMGGIGYMAPQRRKDLAETISFAFIAGTFCGLLNACIAGTLLDAPGYDPDMIVNGTYSIKC